MIRKKTPLSSTVAGDGTRPLSTPALVMMRKVVAKALLLIDDGVFQRRCVGNSNDISRHLKGMLKSYAADLEAAVELGELEAFHDALASAAERVVEASVDAKKRKHVMTDALREAIDRLHVVLDGEGQ